MMLLPLYSLADAVEIDGIYYNLNETDKTAEVTSNPNKYTGDVVIPEKVNYSDFEYVVTTIGNGAFYLCQDLTSISIPHNIIEIGKDTFYGCKGITAVFISDLSSWCNISFAEDDSNPLYYAHHLYLNGVELEELIIPDNVKSINKYSFIGCTNIKKVIFPSDLKSIKDYAFSDCSGIKNIDLSLNNCSLGKYCFQNCTGLESILLPPNLYSINFASFWGCSSLKSIIIPDNLERIEMKSFYGCNNMTKITFGEKIHFIDYDAFYRCSNLNQVHIKNLESWCNTVFYYATSNPLIYAFHLYLNGELIKELIIPQNVKEIYNYCFMDCKDIVSVIIPDNVERINDYCFIRCDSLETVIIGKNIKHIGENAFSNCNSITSFYCYSEQVPSTSNNAFDNSLGNAILYVPSASVDAYKEAEPWKNFKQIVAIEGTSSAKSANVNPVLIQANNGIITVEGAEDGECINVYTPAGSQEGTAISQNRLATINTHIKPGDIAIIKIGTRAVKVMMK